MKRSPSLIHTLMPGENLPRRAIRLRPHSQPRISYRQGKDNLTAIANQTSRQQPKNIPCEENYRASITGMLSSTIPAMRERWQWQRLNASRSISLNSGLVGKMGSFAPCTASIYY